MAPSAAYLLLAHPDWTLLYLLDGRQVSGLAVVPLVLATLGALLGGYAAGARLARLPRGGLALPAAVVGGAVVALALAFLLRGRLGTYGTYAAFHAGDGIPLLHVKLGYVLIAMATGHAAGAGFVAWELWRDACRVVPGSGGAGDRRPTPRFP